MTLFVSCKICSYKHKKNQNDSERRKKKKKDCQTLKLNVAHPDTKFRHINGVKRIRQKRFCINVMILKNRKRREKKSIVKKCMDLRCLTFYPYDIKRQTNEGKREGNKKCHVL